MATVTIKKYNLYSLKLFRISSTLISLNYGSVFNLVDEFNYRGD